MVSRHQTPGGTRPSGPVRSTPQPLAKPARDHPITTAIDGARITLTFDPDKSGKTQHAEWINFHQVVYISTYRDHKTAPQPVKPGDLVPEWKNVDRWTTDDHWFLDEYDSNRPSYYIRYSADKGQYGNGNSRTAVMQDEPGFTIDGLDVLRKLLYHKHKNPEGKYVKLHFVFDTFAVCEVGRDKNIPQWYEGIRWLWEITAAQFYSDEAGSWRGKSFFVSHYNSKPPEAFVAAVEKYRNVSGKD